MNYLLTIDWFALMKIVLAGLFSAVVFVALINWRRHRKEEAAKARKTDAEAEEINERRALIKLERDERIFEISTKMVEKLSQECEQTKKECEQTKQELEATQTELFQVKELLSQANGKIAHLEESLRSEKESNINCLSQVEQLNVELSRLKRSGQRPT